jgi:hypothetical protein
LSQRKAFERVHFICYLNGTDRAAGPLIVKPRAFTDPFAPAPERPFEALPGEESIELPPGSVVVMDAPILHSAWRGTGEELRTIRARTCSPPAIRARIPRTIRRSSARA